MSILWDEWTEKYRWELVGILLAIIAIGIGVFLWKSKSNQPQAVQVLSASDTNSASASATATVILDVAGEVVNPGVYKLPKGARVDDALLLAGGITESGDTNWIEVNLNRAELVRDGMKIYIPPKPQSSSDYTSNISAAPTNPVIKGLIDINSASASELDTLSGVGPVTANKIISGRPYANIDELLSKKIVSKSVFNKIKDQIRAW